ncbi:MAG TPA: hypothetical protein VN419_11720 [Humidesulfovibrio sp.]|uniref:hypothetical protein n=1 Tax=Humidesulfovibrio sp. TaxID=2910988 RepID=UPI002CDA42C3|nr:hypothetical protein [Humidesulfovibrio sp.]HWR04674.1 hypothetical protein [Humidesulfovibrio sp.]
MSAPIGSSTTRSASVAAQTRLVGAQSGVASAALGQAGGSRPQVQSRRVSLKLGPLGITYSTDQLLWPEAAATAGAGAAVADASLSPGLSPDLDPDAEPVDPVSGLPGSGQNTGQTSQTDQAAQQAQAQLTDQQGAAAAGRSFHQELAQAWRRQIEQRAATTETYGPGGASRSGISTAVTSAEAGSSAPAATAAASTAGTASSAAATATTPSAENTTAPPAARMRRAIGAYLACARDFSTAQPMLTAVA